MNKKKGQSFSEYLLLLTFVTLLSLSIWYSFGQAANNLLNTSVNKYKNANQQQIVSVICINNKCKEYKEYNKCVTNIHSFRTNKAISIMVMVLTPILVSVKYTS